MRWKFWCADEQGTVGIIFGLSLLPLMGLAGAAIDYGRAVDVRTRLQTSLDSAALSAAKDAAGLDDTQLTTRAKAFVEGNLKPATGAQLTSFSLVRDTQAKTIKVSGTAKVDTSLLPVIGINSVEVGGDSKSTWGVSKIEVALALDNTGSMASNNKMTELKKASKNMVDILNAIATEPDLVKIGIVPFATQVRPGVAMKDEPWLKFRQNSGDPSWMAYKASWTGCVADRDQSYDTDDTLPEVVTSGTLYPAVNCANSTLAEIQPMLSMSSTNQTNANALKAKIDSMTPTGNTNVTIGVAWGMAMLSNKAPLSQGIVPTAENQVSKHLIVLTDGDNTQNRFTTNGTLIDDRTRLACTAAKAAGYVVYTVRVIDGDANLLRSCASVVTNYYSVSSASQLTVVFQQIAAKIGNIRLTN